MTFVGARKELLNRLNNELVGPEALDETLSIKPLQKYLCGILWPINSEVANEENDVVSGEGKDTNKEEIEMLAPLAKAMNPSAIGLSFLIDQKNTKVNVSVKFGMYETLGDNENWRRTDYNQFKNISIDFSKLVGKRKTKQVTENKNIYLEWFARPYGSSLAVSMFLVNRNIQEPDNHKIDHLCVFQPEIRIKGNGEAPFVVRRAFSNNEDGYKDADTLSNDLLYRDETVFAVGHSIAVDWEDVSEDFQRAGELITKILPFYEIPMVIPPDWDQDGTLNMRELAEFTTGEKVKKALQPLCDGYQKWIQDRNLEAQNIENDTHRQTAIEHMEKCEVSLVRMKKGLDLINDPKNTEIFKAFQFANKAMAIQREQSVSISTGQTPKTVKAIWRPFQIAFILQNLEGIVDPECENRNLADLLWFPTGGGKTEAYLGLAAFTIGYRRMKRKENYRTDAGVSIIMRYTLRLLTIQQFQRATALICACEYIRRSDSSTFGNRPFRIGLWVGEKSVPNEFDDANETISKLRDKAFGKKDVYIDQSKGSPVQLVSCPWCGHALTDEEKKGSFLKAYKAKIKNRRVQISCPNKQCDFHHSNSVDGLPVVVTDEEIYRLLPDMLIGTVDKFARMPWKPEVQNLFGKVKGEVDGWGFLSHGHSKKEITNVKNVAGGTSINNDCELHPPDLIIQDELHLISGPLGTMVGLYETAIDYLSSIDYNGKKIGPKVIASTATIRNADKQIEGLFTREARIFPSPGLSHKDSFFAKQRPLDEKPGRVYAGVFAPGRSMKTALLRVYANLLSSTTAMEAKYNKQTLDPYHTLVGYFNSLRELGGAVRLIEDDVPARMKTLENQTEAHHKYGYKVREYERDVPELTSRIDSDKIPQLLKQLEQPYFKQGDLKPVDVILASNMISVGVDVPRLGVMAVNGQPKTTAEYIQSTSRVGRSNPGLVLTVYNWIRPRDISHYEEFYAYHAAMYRYVEPISVTPFASRARDRGLAGTFVSMTRLGNQDMTANQSADQFLIYHGNEQIQEIILKRVNDMKLSQDEVEADLKKLYQTWEDAIEKSKIVYSYSRKKEVNNLLQQFGENKNGDSFKIPNSMRDVEATAGIYLGRD